MRLLILASASPRRWELLRQVGLHFTAMPVLIEEEILPQEKASEAAERLALRKAEACSKNLSRALVLGLDTVVALDRRILGKPRDEEHAREMLRALSGRAHDVTTGLALLDLDSGGRWIEHETTQVTFRSLEEDEIDQYVRSGEPMDKAGAYGIQGGAAFFIPRIEGCYFNVVGLPLFRLGRMLQKAKISVK
jgi:septum formation protein